MEKNIDKRIDIIKGMKKGRGTRTIAKSEDISWIKRPKEIFNRTEGGEMRLKSLQ